MDIIFRKMLGFRRLSCQSVWMLLTILCFLVTPSSSHATQTTINFSGVLNGYLPISGWIGFDSDNPTYAVPNAMRIHYAFEDQNFGFYADLDGTIFEASSVTVVVTNNGVGVTPEGEVTYDGYYITATGLSLPGYEGEISLSLSFIDNSALLLQSLELPTQLPGLNVWDVRQLQVYSPWGVSGAAPSVLLFGDIMSAQLVPEPSMNLLLITALLVLSCLSFKKDRSVGTL